MGNPVGFLEYSREVPNVQSVETRVKDFREFMLPLGPKQMTEQAARCQDCGIPFCHATGCPVDNLIPEFNDLLYQGRWQEACEVLHSTNNFPEFTGRVCPAPCEAACTLSIESFESPVLIKHIELQIVERGWCEGWIVPLVAEKKTGKSVAVVGSGPAGLAAAQQLARAGHAVTVFEKNEQPGGLLRLGIPDFKLEKEIVERRVDQMSAEGVEFLCSVEVGKDVSLDYLRRMFDAVCLTLGSEEPRPLDVPGAELKGVHYAMDYLTAQNRKVAGDVPGAPISAKGKNVVVIGGGDTGSDCVGTAIRQGAKSVHQFEILPEPPEQRPPSTPWPQWPAIKRTSTSHQEGCTRRWSVLTKSLEANKNQEVASLRGIEVEWTPEMKLKEKSGTDFEIQADLVLLAMGFIHPQLEQLPEKLEKDARGNVKTNGSATNIPGVFAAGDCATGASLVVRAIKAGRNAADEIDEFIREK